jgi:hypothetical protein
LIYCTLDEANDDYADADDDGHIALSMNIYIDNHYDRAGNGPV